MLPLSGGERAFYVVARDKGNVKFSILIMHFDFAGHVVSI
jgi:hypothetical protein